MCRVINVSVRVFFVLLFLMGLVACGGGGDDGPQDRIRVIQQNPGTELTELPAKVSVSFKTETIEGKPVPNLTLDEFEFFEDGSRISVTESQSRIIPEESEFVYSTLLLLDFSDSVALNFLEDLKQGAASFIEQVLPPGTEQTLSKELAVATFDGREDILVVTQGLDSEFMRNRELLMQVVLGLSIENDLERDGSTNFYGAVQKGIAMLGARLEANQKLDPTKLVAGSLVIFTDGTDQAARVTEATAVRAVQESKDNLTVFTIGLGGEINPDLLRTIGRDGFQQAGDLGELVNTFAQTAQLVVDETNSFYKLEYCSPKRSGQSHELIIVANREGERGELVVQFSAESFTSGCFL